MTIAYHSKFGSILFSTACLVAFALLAGPVMKPNSVFRGDLDVRQPLRTSAAFNLSVGAGKSVIVESPKQIVRASVDNPELAVATSIDEHELLVNAKTPGDTGVTLWQADGSRTQMTLHVERVVEASAVPAGATNQQVAYHGVAASYENAFDRVQNAITGVAR